MQIYGLRLNYFFRFGENNNSVVFDISKADQKALEEGKITLDEIYDKLAKNPIGYVNQIEKEGGLTKLITIEGALEGNTDRSNGIGKCFAENTKILMFDGSIKFIQDIVRGDLLMGPDSKPRSVLSTHNGKDNLYKVNQWHKNSYVVNSVHDLVLETKDKRYNNSKYRLNNDDNDDLYQFKISIQNYLESTPTFKKCMCGFQSQRILFEKQDVLINPYLLGIWLGDGDFIYNGTLDDMKQKKEDLRCYNLVNNKHIPQEYKANSEEIRLELLAGIIDSTGSYHNGTFDVVSKFEIFVNDIAFLARSLGFFVYLRPYFKTCKNNGISNKYWHISISGNIDKIPVKLNRKQAPLSKMHNNHLLYSIDVEDYEYGKYYGIEVDMDHLFLLDDFTVVHNSSLMEAICYANYEKIVRRNVNTTKDGKAGLAVVSKINGKYPDNMRLSYVEQIFEEDGKFYRIRRGREFTKTHRNNSPILEFECYNESSPESREGHTKGRTEEAIAEVITTDYDVFVNSSMFGQNDAGKFLIGTDKIRKEMLISLLRLEDLVQGWLQEARNRKNAKIKEVEASKSKIELCRKRIEESRTADQMRTDFEHLKFEAKEITSKISEIDNQIKKLSESAVLLKSEQLKEDGRKIQSELESKKKEVDKQIQTWRELYTQAETSGFNIEKNIVKLDSRKNSFEKDIETRQKMINAFSDVDTKAELKEIKKASEEYPKISKKLEDQRSQEKGLLEQQGKVKGEISYFDKEIKSLSSQLEIEQDEFMCEKCKSIVSKDHIKNCLKEENKKRDFSQKKFRENEEIMLKVVETIKDLKKQEEDLSGKIFKEASVNFKIDKNKQDYTRLKELQDGAKETESQIEDLKSQINDVEKKKKEYRQEAITIKENFKESIDVLEANMNEIKSKLLEIKDESQKITSQLEGYRKEKSFLDKEKVTLSTKAGKLKQEKETLLQERELLKSIEEELKTETKSLNRLLILENIYGLDGIQTRIVKKYLPLLNVYIKEFLDILSHGDMQVKMAINDQSEIIIVISGGTADTYEMLSGGEKMLVRLSVDIGLALLSFCRTASKPEIICLDEIFGSLDNTHIAAVFKLLRALQDKFKRVLVISHNANINERIKNKIQVNKRRGNLGLSEIQNIV